MLQVITRQQAKERIRQAVRKKEPCSLYFPEERYADEDYLSPEDLPPHSRSVVDGYAVHASDTYGCSEAIPAVLACDGSIRMGEMPDAYLPAGRCCAIPTGGFLPEGADAVSMIEYTDDMGDEFRYVLKPVAVSENVNRKGDDCRKGDVLIRKGEKITSRNIAVIAAVGIPQVKSLLRNWLEMSEKPENAFSVGILSTGDELVEYDQIPRQGQIRNINAVMIAAAVREMGLIPVIYPIVTDDLHMLEEALERCVSECDAVCISGGTSVGEKDHVFQVLSGKGTVDFHGLAVKPGKPTMFGRIDETPVFSLPGHPMAAFLIFLLIVKPALLQMSGQTEQTNVRRAYLSRKLSSNHGREEIVPVKLEGDRAVPLRAGSGVVSVLARADGYIIIDRNAEGLLEGDIVEVNLF